MGTRSTKPPPPRMPLPWERYPADWSATAVWPRVILGATRKEPSGSHLLQPAPRHHLMLFRANVTVGVINEGETLERTLHLADGDVVVRPQGLPSQQHRWSSPEREPFELVHVVLDPAHCGPPPSYRLALDTIYKIPDPLIGRLIDALHDAAKRKWSGDDRFVDSATELLCLRFQDCLADAIAAIGSGSLAAEALREVCEHVEDHLHDAHRIATLAEIAGLSPSHFVREFKAATGLTPARYVLKRRVVRAEALLRSSAMSIVEISRETGFRSQSQFTTTFHKLAGMTPAQFRKTTRAASTQDRVTR
jgi:AraC-like DNA-binding protein